MKRTFQLLLLFNCLTGCKRQELQTNTDRPWEEFSRIIAFMPSVATGAFVGTVEEIQEHRGFVTTLGAVVDPGVWMKVRLDELVAGREGGDDEPAWHVGDTVWAASGTTRACMRGLPLPGDRVVLFPGKAPTEGPDHRASARVAVFAQYFMCAKGETVQLEDHHPENLGGVIEVAAVSLPAMRATIRMLWGVNALDGKALLRQQVRDQCARLACPENLTCFFGQECVDLTYLAPLTRTFAPDGTEDPQPATNTTSGP